MGERCWKVAKEVPKLAKKTLSRNIHTCTHMHTHTHTHTYDPSADTKREWDLYESTPVPL